MVSIKNKISPWLGLIALLAAGCSLHDPLEFGSHCPPEDDPNGVLAYIGNETCTAESCQLNDIIEPAEFFKRNLCPKDYSSCKKVSPDRHEYWCDILTKVEHQCATGLILCEHDNDDGFDCIDPNADTTCGAKTCSSDKNYDGIDCTAYSTPQTCTFNPDTKLYACSDLKCDANEMTCKDDEGLSTKCVRRDILHCSSCDNNCMNAAQPNTVADSCLQLESGEFTCTYKCLNPYTNCGSEFENKCVDTNIDNNNCGECNHICDDNENCINGNCTKQNCDADKCSMNGECLENSKYCGPNCMSCIKGSHEGICLKGTCIYDDMCVDGEHPVYNESNHVIECRANTLEACAPKDAQTDTPIANCNDLKTENAEEVICNTSGHCEVINCATNFHLNKEKNACEPTTDQLCAATDSSEIKDCKTKGVESVSCENGKCVVANCQTNYHLNKEKTACEPTDNQNCAATDSNDVASCKSGQTCKNGKCICPTGKGLNYDKTACIPNVCVGIIGVKDGKEFNYGDYTGRCDITACTAGFEKTPIGHTNYCRKTCSKNSDCPSNLGYNQVCNTDKYCSHANCALGFKTYHEGCVAHNTCCGGNCINCVAKGKKCTDAVCK